ncbi:MAG: hypothetical protein FJ306_10795 [Planctomycetes bacterium]|nr:hypothetical protein [Planctomycetota bacterium]
MTLAGIGPQRAAARMAWLLAVVLLALAVAGGAPAVPGVGAGEARLEQCDVAAPRRAAVAATVRAVAAPGADGVVDAVPRPRPRARDVQCRGLPPARAPTC